MKKKIVIISIVVVIIILTVILLVVTGQKESLSEYKCVDEIGCITIGPGEPIIIGVLQPLSGRLKNSGTVQIRGIELALSRRNNTLFGHQIELLIEDSQCSPEGGANSAIKIVADPRIVGIIGPNCSGAAAQASKIMSEAGFVMISGTNSAANLTSTEGKANEDWYPGYFRTMYNSIKRGEAAAIYAFKELGLTKAATINDGDSRSIELTQIFEKTFKDMGGEIVLSTAIDRQDTNMKPVLERVAGNGAQIIFYPFFPPETIYLTRQAREIPGLESTALMVCGSTMRNNDFINSVGEAGKGLYFVGKSQLSGEIFIELQKEYNSKYPDLHDDTLYAFSFDAANILLNALEKVIRQEEDGTLHIGRQALRDAMYATMDHHGATGALSSDRFGDCGTPQFNILRLDDPAGGYDSLIKNEVFKYIPEK